MPKLKGIKLKCYPTKQQEKLFNQYIGNNRFVWNSFLYLNKLHYENTKTFLFNYDMCNLLPSFKSINDFLNISIAQSLQQELRALDIAIKASFKSKGFPKFKKKVGKNSFHIPERFKISNTKKSILIPKSGYVKCHLPRTLKQEGIRNVTISKENNNWYIALCIKHEPSALPKTNKHVGLDLGTVRLATNQHGRVIKKFEALSLEVRIKTTQRKLQRRQQLASNGKLARNQSKGYMKTKYTLNKLHTKLKNKRLDYLHKESTKLVRRYDTIVIEDLKTSSMTRQVKRTSDGSPRKNVNAKSGLNKSILNQGWGLLINMLDYKCKWYGKTLIKVDPKNTSRKCSSCGFTNKYNRKSQAKFKCLQCGYSANADKNAATNIFNLGFKLVA